MHPTFDGSAIATFCALAAFVAPPDAASSSELRQRLALNGESRLWRSASFGDSQSRGRFFFSRICINSALCNQSLVFSCDRISCF
uniref:Uncharacterized protein n=1 Tax=Picea sitchensis TaxID=3332 RepID=D5A9K2_PICSI|nr:unknown [Picea sitchensis]